MCLTKRQLPNAFSAFFYDFTPVSAACNREAMRQRMQQPSRHARFMARYASSTNALVAWDFDAREPDELSLRRGASLDT